MCLITYRHVVYIVPLVPAAGEKKIYIRALEKRIAELELYLNSIGHNPRGGVDHLGHLRQPTSSAHIAGEPTSQSRQVTRSQVQQDKEECSNDILLAVRDLSLSASGHYIGASSNITMGRVLGSFVHSQRSSISSPYEEFSSQSDDDPAPKSIYSTNEGDMIGVPFLSPQVATRLLHG